MPIIHITLAEGFDKSVQTQLERRLTDAACAVTGAAPQDVTVVASGFAGASDPVKSQLRQPDTGAPTASRIVVRFLAAMEARDLDAAGAFLAPDFTMTFPGSRCFTTLQALAEWASQRYRSIKKTYEHFEELESGDTRIVYCSGTLGGEWRNGELFTGIRFIDRFEVKDGLLHDQRVWNDLAENFSQTDRAST